MSDADATHRPIKRPGLRATLLNAVLHRYSKTPAEKLPKGRQVEDRHLEKGARRIAQTMKRNEKLPAFIHLENVSVPTPAGPMDAEWLSSTKKGHEPQPGKVVLYFHGGGYFMCSAATHRPLTWRLAHGGARKVLSINYRQAPAHRFPAWLDDAVSAYRFLLDQGYAAKDIALGGDSAGGNLVLITLQQIRTEQLPMPGAAFCLSPWACMAGESPSLVKNAPKDVMFAAHGVTALARYHVQEQDPKHPLLSPVYADYHGFPPLLLQVGSTEVLRDDSRRVAAKARAEGVTVQLEEWHNLPHVFHIFADYIPEGPQAIGHINAFVKKHA